MFGYLVVGSEPLPDPFAFVPSGIIPEEHDHFFLLCSGNSQERNNEEPHVFTIGLALGEIQHGFLGVLAHRPKTGQGFLRLLGTWGPLEKPQRTTRLAPGKGVRLGKAREPTLILFK